MVNWRRFASASFMAEWMADEKDAAMQAFAAGETQVLMATSVVEVGIDVPNATLMTIAGRRTVRTGSTCTNCGAASRAARIPATAAC